MHIIENQPITAFNTFGLAAVAEHFVRVKNVQEARNACRLPFLEKRVLGGGSNILFAHNPTGLLIKNEIDGIEANAYKSRVHVTVGGGVVWHDLVVWAVQHNYGGLENLSLIPGTVGASPVQNIGAYGVELKDVFVRCRAVNLYSGQEKTFTKKALSFGYRDSYFKNEGQGKWLITSVTFSLSLGKHILNTSYGAITSVLENKNIKNPTIADISQAVIDIRSSKLPDPAKIGNCGSFFKNPEVDRGVFDRVFAKNPTMPSYPLGDGQVKIPAGWLIEQCGWKGKRIGNTGCYTHQALVLVNHGGATGKEVETLAKDIIASVKARFGIQLSAEVNIW